MTSTTTISSSLARHYQTQWRTIVTSRSQMDYKTAQLAAAVRKEFPSGRSGDRPFSDWVREHFDITGVRARGLLNAARAFQSFAREGDWIQLGGWSSITRLMGLEPGPRRIAMQETLRRAAKAGRPATYNILRAVCIEHGFMSKKPGHQGGPSRVKVERKVQTLRDFVLALYHNTRVAVWLPEIPADVKAILDHDSLAAKTAALRAAA